VEEKGFTSATKSRRRNLIVAHLITEREITDRLDSEDVQIITINYSLHNRNRNSEIRCDEIVVRILDVQSILETALGNEVRDCCFLESITITLS
jgi:hypothetical protein